MQELLLFVKGYPIVSYDKGQIVLSEGDPAEYILILSSGFAKVVSLYGDGNEQTLWLTGRLDIVPTEQLFSKRSPLAFTYVALSTVNAYKIPKQDFLAFAESEPLLMKEIARGLSNHYDDLLSRMSSITQASARDKLVSTLHNIANRFSVSDSLDLFEIGLNITHKDIASLIHSSRETASIELKKLKDEGAITYTRDSFVIFPDKLESIVEAL